MSFLEDDDPDEAWNAHMEAKLRDADEMGSSETQGEQLGVPKASPSTLRDQLNHIRMLIDTREPTEEILGWIEELCASREKEAREDTYKHHNLYCDKCGELKKVYTNTYSQDGELAGGICQECWRSLQPKTELGE